MSSTHFSLSSLSRSCITWGVLCMKKRCTTCKTIRQCFYDRYGEIYDWAGLLRKDPYSDGIKLTVCYESPFEGLLDQPGLSLFLFYTPNKSWKGWIETQKILLERRLRPQRITFESSDSWRGNNWSGIEPSRVDPQTIDARRVLKWIKTCELSHGERCRVPKDSNSKPPDSFRLIDIRQQCLVSGSFFEAYVAVSYVWGSTPMFKATRSNISRLETPGSLRALDCRLPATVSDAMDVASAIGIRYVWVDALCIIQDDKESKHVQIGQMHQIYRNAFLTVVAAAGSNADAGLPGVTAIRPRKIKQVVIRLEQSDYFVSQRPLESLLGETRVMASKQTSTWNTRAWTYQERIFSTRKLVFLDEGVHWNCNCVTWMEDIKDHSVSNRHYFQMFDFNPFHNFSYDSPSQSALAKDSYCAGLLSNPDLDDFCTIVREYSARQLTYEDDVLNALSGTLTTLNFDGGFLFGLPRAFLFLCLLWQPQNAVSRRSPLTSSHLKSKFPSWCWSGWTGPISTENWYSKQTSDHRLTTIERYLSPAVPSTFHTARFHEPEDMGDIPVPENPYLMVTTELARFGLSSGTFSDNVHIHVASIMSSFGVECGFVQLHNGSHPIFSQATEDWKNLAQYDFISVSRGEIAAYILEENCGSFVEWERPRPAFNGMYKYQNVLLLAWEGGIVYRAGLGRIDERAWKNSSPVTKVVRLG